MSWSPVGPDGRRPRTLAVTMCVSPGEGTHQRRVTITFRDPEVVALPWMAVGKSVDVMIGHGEHAGRLRIVRGAGSLLINVSGRPKRDVQVSIRSAALAASLPLRPGRIAPEGCGYDFADDWIEIDLPKWALPASPLAAPRVSDLRDPPPAPKVVTPHRGILADVPCVISRAAGGPVR